MPEQTRAPVLRDVTNEGGQKYTPSPLKDGKAKRSEGTVYRGNRRDPWIRTGRRQILLNGWARNSFTSARIKSKSVETARTSHKRNSPLHWGACLQSQRCLSRPAPGRCCYCHEGLHKLASGLGHGAFNERKRNVKDSEVIFRQNKTSGSVLSHATIFLT